MEQITLYFKNGASDKIYQVTLDDRFTGWVVEFAYGRRGSTLTLGTKTAIPVSYEKAKAIYDKLLKEKQAKGYTVGEDGTPYTQAAQAGLATGIHCQLLNPVGEGKVEQYISDSAFCMEEKFDGRRLLIEKKGRMVTGINRLGLKVAIPSTIELSALSFDGDFVIDGEAVGDHLHVFDILSRNGEDLRPRWYVERRSDLIKILRKGPQGFVELVETAYEENHKRELFDHCKASGREGVVFKRKLAPYIAGRPASGGSQFKFKFCETASFIVSKVNTKRSVSLSLIDCLHVGSVTIPANQEIPAAGAVVEVRYLYAYRAGSIFQPVYLGQRDDIQPEECVVSQLKYKSEPQSVA